jgi:exosome complex RNA-binding protein Rrp4
MGVIAAPGLVVTVPLDYARKLLKPNERIVTALGKEIKIEIIVGVNGKVW